jgi:hypothetical protein
MPCHGTEAAACPRGPAGEYLGVLECLKVLQYQITIKSPWLSSVHSKSVHVKEEGDCHVSLPWHNAWPEKTPGEISVPSGQKQNFLAQNITMGSMENGNT